MAWPDAGQTAAMMRAWRNGPRPERRLEERTQINPDQLRQSFNAFTIKQYGAFET